jgi:uncharacterized lipoprotein
MTAWRILVAAAAGALLSGCHNPFHRLAADCHAPQEYQRARQVAPLRVPTGLDAPNVQSALVIPDVDPAAPTGGKGSCLDAPPRYKPAPSNKAGG